MTDRRDFFISFNGADLAYAEAIDAALRMAGFTTYYHPRDLKPGGNIAMWMDDALMNSAQTLALYSPSYVADRAIYSRTERYATWWQDPISDKRKLIPIVLTDAEMPPLMAPIKHIDVKGKTVADAAAFVVAQLNAPMEKGQRDIWRRAQPLPPIFHAAYRPNPNFTGRFEALESLHHTLRHGSNAAITAVAGMGGIGKTTLAAEYCHRFGGMYAGVWWVRAEQESVMLGDLQMLGQRLGVAKGDNIEADASATLGHLAHLTSPWLLIYDNAPNPDAVRRFLPIGTVRCIITSRFSEFGDVAQVTLLGQWPEDVTAGYILNRAKRGTLEEATKLARALGGLPLAAEQAAAYLANHTGFDFDEYSTDIARLIKRKRDAGIEGSYPDTVYAAFVKSLETLEKSEFGSGALDIVRVCAFLSPDGVDLALLAARWGAKVFPEHFAAMMADKSAREDALATLKSFSLMRIENGPIGLVLNCHRLLLEVARDWMGEKARGIWAGAAAAVVNTAFPFAPDEDTSVWSICSRLMPHVGPLNTYLTKFGIESRALGRLLHQASIYLVVRGDRTGALAFAQISVAWVYGNDSHRPLDLAIRLGHLGGRYADLDRLDDAEDALRASIKIEEEHLPSHDPTLSVSYNNLADVRWRKKDFVEALKLLSHSMEIQKATHGESSPGYGQAMSNLGAIYSTWAGESHDASHLVQADELLPKALAIICDARGFRHPAPAQVHKNLAALRWEQGDLLSASNECELAVATMLSLDLMDSYLLQDYQMFLLNFWKMLGKDEAARRLRDGDVRDLFVLIEQIESQHRAWVARDPENRRFGPPSSITGATA